jgi:hypothetical protein
VIVMPLKSKSFRGDPKLEAAAVSHPSHITLGATGIHVSKVQRALIQLFDQAAIERAELSEAKYGPTTKQTVQAFKSQDGKEIVNKSYQPSPDAIVGIMTMAELDKQLGDKESSDPDFLFFRDEQKAMVKSDIRRSKVMVEEALRRLRLVSGIGADGGMIVTPRNFRYYDTRLKVLKVFRINSFSNDDLPVSLEIDRQFRSEVSGYNGMPDSGGDFAEQMRFSRLLENFVKLRASLDAPFDKEFYTMGTFRGTPLGFFAAFVDANRPTDTTVRFTRSYFDAQIIATEDDRAVTIAHERCHTIFRANGHPGTGDNPFCVTPHLGDPNVTTADDALMNPYCYEWLIKALQPSYIARVERHNGCGT